MKVRIKSFNGELPSYLTVGKLYDATGDGISCEIIDDDGDVINVYILCSSHLNDGSWEIVDKESNEVKG